MSAATTVAKREIKTYFNSPVAYIVVTVFMLIAGYLYWSQLFLEKQAELRYYFTLTPLIFTFIIPAMTMRLLAEERQTGTIVLLSSSPVRESEIVLGKFFSSLIFVSFSFFSRALIRDWTAFALFACARNRLMNSVSRSRSALRFFARPSRIVSSSARDSTYFS